MSPRTVDETIDRNDTEGDGEESGSPLRVAVTQWYVWIAAAITIGLAGYAFTHNITGPVDEYLFAVIAVALLVVAVGRPIQAAWD